MPSNSKIDKVKSRSKVHFDYAECEQSQDDVVGLKEKGETRKEKRETRNQKKQDKTPYENPIFVNKTLLVRKYQNLRKEKQRSTYCVSNSSALT